MSVRALIERLSRQVVVKRRLPVKFGRRPLFVSPAAALSYWHLDIGKVDHMLLDVAFEHVRAGDVVWDIGANVGLFAFAAASLSGATGRVLAVEPDIWLANLLHRSAGIDENQRLKIDILPVAVTNAVDLREFNIAMRGRASNHLATSVPSPMAGGVRETQLVPTVTIDWLLARYPAPRFVKLDVEGTEFMVLQAAEQLLAEVKPAIFLEIPWHHAQDITHCFRRFGYTMYDAEIQSRDRRPLEYVAANALAYPPGYSR